MSDPVDRSPNPDEVSHFASKWARYRESVSGQSAGPQLPKASGLDTATNVGNPRFDAERSGLSGSLEPSRVPKPPAQEPWWRHSGVIRASFRFLLVVFLGALTGLVIVVVLPNIQSFVAKQSSVTNLFGARFDGDSPKTLAWSSTTASEPKPVGAARSNSAPPAAERRTAAIDPAAVPVKRPQPTVATPGPANPAPATSLPANPAPAGGAPPTANVAPSAPSVPVAAALARPAEPAIGTPGPADPAPPTSLSANPSSAVVAPPTVNATLGAASVPAASVNTVPVQSGKPVRSLGPDEIKILLKQGEDFVSVGDFASARLVFGRVWEANDARGALAFAATYDPVELARIGAKGATPDVAKAREWYVKARDIGSPDAAPRLEALASRNFAVTAQKSAMASTGKEVANEAASQNSLSNDAAAPAGSYWKHGGSIMRLEAKGLSRKFLFYKPSDAELQAGAKAESLLFDGQISGKGYTGTAFLYSDKCGRSAFQVSGQIENNNGRVILSGRSPQVDSDCREIGKSEQELVFDLVEAPSK
jgi:hypothetical protein